VAILGRQQHAQQLLEALPDQMKAIVSKELDDRAYGGTLSISRISSLFSSAMLPMQTQLNAMQAQIASIAAGRNTGGDAAAPSGPLPDDEAMIPYGGWKWTHGKYRRVSDSFAFPDCTPEVLLEHWYIGSETLGVPPLEMLASSDVNWIQRGERTLCDARAMVKAVVDEAKRQNIWGDGPHSPSQLHQIYRSCRDGVGTTAPTPSGRKSNVCNSWRTALRKMQVKRRSEGRGRSSAVASEPPTRRRRVDNTNRVDRNPHNRRGRGAAGTGPRLRSHGEMVLAAGLAAAAPPAATEQITLQQAQGASFVDAVVGVEHV
jgi:hypothetical protein